MAEDIYKVWQAQQAAAIQPSPVAPAPQVPQAVAPQAPDTGGMPDVWAEHQARQQNPLHYSQMTEEQQQFLPEDAGVLDYLQVLARPGEATVSGLEGLTEGESAGQLWDRAKAELMTPHGIVGAKEVLMRQMPGTFKDTKMEDVDHWYQAIDPVDVVGLAADIAIDPLWLAPPAKGVELLGKGLGVGGKAFAKVAPETAKVISMVAHENKITKALGYGFGGNDYLLGRLIRNGKLTSKEALMFEDNLALATGHSDVALDEALRLATRGIKELGLSDVELKAVSHLMERGQGAGKFINNPVARSVKIGGKGELREGAMDVAVTPDMMTFAKESRDFFDKWAAQFADEGMDIGHIENYVHHLFPEQKQSWLRRFFLGDEAVDSAKRTGGLKPAAFEQARREGQTLETLLHSGYAPEEDIVKIMTKYHIEASRTMASRKLMDFTLENYGTKIDLSMVPTTKANMRSRLQYIRGSLKKTTGRVQGHEMAAKQLSKRMQKLGVSIEQQNAVSGEAQKIYESVFDDVFAELSTARAKEAVAGAEGAKLAMFTGMAPPGTLDLKAISKGAQQLFNQRLTAEIEKRSAQLEGIISSATRTTKTASIKQAESGRALAKILKRQMADEGKEYAKRKLMGDLQETLAHLGPDQIRMARDKGMVLYTAKGRFADRVAPQKLPGGKALKLEDDGFMVMKEIAEGDVQTLLSGGREVFALPREMGEVLNRHFEAFSDTGRNAVAQHFKQFNSWWKSYALLSPGFHIRNGYGGIFNNYIAGVKNPNRYRQAIQAAKVAVSGDPAKIQERLSKIPVKGIRGKGGKNVSMWNLWEEARLRGAVDTTTFFTEEFKPVTASAKAGALFTKKGRAGLGGKDIAKMIAPGRDNLLIEGSRVAGNGVENILRFSLYLDRRIKGDDVAKAVKAVKRTHFDYRHGLTPFERDIRDYAIPFYSWLRFNVPFQMNNLYRQPGKYAAIPRVVQAISGTETAAEEKYKPGYFKELGTFKMPGWETDEGWSLYFYPDFPFKDIMTAANLIKPATNILSGQAPDEDSLKELGAEIMQNAGPIPKVIIERLSGFNFFQKRELGRGEYDEFPSGLSWLPDALKGVIGGQKKGDHWVMTQNNINAIEALMPLVARIDRTFPSEKKYGPEHVNALMSVMLGLKFYVHDMEKHKRWYGAKLRGERAAMIEQERGRRKALAEIQAEEQSPWAAQPQFIRDQLDNMRQIARGIQGAQ